MWTFLLASHLHDGSSRVCVCVSCSGHFNLNYSTALSYKRICLSMWCRDWFLSVCQGASTERDSLPVWPCGKLKLEAANEQANTNRLCTWSCVCVCVGATVGILKFLPGEWQAYQRPESLPAQPVAFTQVYTYMQLKSSKSAYSFILPTARWCHFYVLLNSILHTLVCR